MCQLNPKNSFFCPKNKFLVKNNSPQNWNLHPVGPPTSDGKLKPHQQCNKPIDKQRNRETDKQTNRQIDKQTNRQTGSLE